MKDGHPPDTSCAGCGVQSGNMPGGGFTREQHAIVHCEVSEVFYFWVSSCLQWSCQSALRALFVLASCSCIERPQRPIGAFEVCFLDHEGHQCISISLLLSGLL